MAKENVLWPLTGLVFAGYNALTGSPEESGPPVFRFKLNLTCFPHHRALRASDEITCGPNLRRLQLIFLIDMFSQQNNQIFFLQIMFAPFAKPPKLFEDLTGAEEETDK